MKCGAILGLGLILVGCASSVETRYMIHQTGSRLSDRAKAHDDCKIASFKEIPQTQGVATIRGYSSPGTLHCNTIGAVTSCNRIGAVNIPSQTSSYDVNGKLRKRYMDRCLNEKGFSVIPLTAKCRSREDIAGVVADRNSQRPADKIHCYYGPSF